MMWIATKSRCQEIDRLAQSEFGIAQSDLMEAAGQSVFNVVCEWIPIGRRLAVVCGKGKNGADGFVVARLARQAGYAVTCLVGASELELNDAAANQLKRLRRVGVEPIFCDRPGFFETLDEYLNQDLIVDALLGTGADGLVREPYKTLIEAMNRSVAEIVCVDIPSGLACDTGEPLGICINASETVTFGLPNPFLFQGQGQEMTGVWSVADIGFPQDLLAEPTDAELLTEVAHLLPKRAVASHKGSNGSLIIIAGSSDMRGAAVLAARAALRAGIGLVTVASIESVLAAVAAHCPEATLMGQSADLIRSRLDRYDAAIFGPGLSTDPHAEALLRDLWADWDLPCVVDADALNLVASGVPLPTAKCVLTPHPGEMARLMPGESDTRFGLAKKAAAKFNNVIVLKGAYTLIATHGEAVAVNTCGNSGMATAGMGDVLSGVIGTLLAQGLSCSDAAKLGVFWHAKAGDACRDKIGSVGFTAMEVADALVGARNMSPE
ncbi:MAG: NAD(P)H-hydrate dehydratase [Fimbriimonadaceae bacterium]